MLRCAMSGRRVRCLERGRPAGLVCWCLGAWKTCYRRRSTRRPARCDSSDAPSTPTPGRACSKRRRSVIVRRPCTALVWHTFVVGDDGAPSKDATAAKDYLQAAAELGHPRAQAALGNIYYDEMEALRSLAQAHDYQAAAAAHKWLSRASEQGELSATRTLVPLYITKGRLDLALRTFAVRVRQSLW